MKIGIFGGTFSPIHNGHLNIVKDVKTELKLDVIFVVPTYMTPDKKFNIEEITPKDRYNMVSKIIKNENKQWLKVSNYEFKKKKISLTYKTINYFKKKYPKDDLYFIMGEDRYFGFEKWAKHDQIIKNSKIVVYRRNEKINNRIGNNAIYLKKNYYDISSTNILSKFEWHHIPQSAKKYISKKNLYLKRLTFNTLGENRYQHSIAVASHSKRLANKYKYKNEKDAYIAGMIHDLFKLKDDDFLKDYYLKNESKPDLSLPNKSLHGFVCALWLEKEYGMKNKEILNSIKNHTLGNVDASKLEKIVFISDKISTDRKGDKVGKIRKLAYKNLDETYEKLLKILIVKLRKKNIEPHKNTLEAYEKIIKRKLNKKNEYSLKKNKEK